MILAVTAGSLPAADAPDHVREVARRFRVMAEIEALGPLPADKRLKSPYAALRATPDQLRQLHALLGRVIELVEQHERDGIQN